VKQTRTLYNCFEAKLQIKHGRFLTDCRKGWMVDTEARKNDLTEYCVTVYLQHTKELYPCFRQKFLLTHFEEQFPYALKPGSDYSEFRKKTFGIIA
jgi:hypothetical protein